MNVLETRDLCFSYGDIPVLSGINLELEQGSFAALIGSNGAGKSTLLKLLLGELTPTAGSIHLLGQEFRQFRDWTKIGYVSQDGLGRHADFPASVQEIVQANLFAEIGLFRLPRKEHREKVRHALELVGMADYAGRLIGELSGGQRQRVLLARALVSSPRLMILDEPTTGMDWSSGEAFYRLLSDLNRETGLSILMVTHDVTRITSLVSHIFCLECGTMAHLTPEQLRDENAHRHIHPTVNKEGETSHGHL